MDITIKRYKKTEAEKAIKTLEQRGYTVIYPLTEKFYSGKTFKPDENKRKIFVENNFSTYWIAKLRKIE